MVFRMMSSVLRTLLVGGAFALISCGSSTAFVDSWKDPDAKPIAFKKIVAIAVLPDETNRRITEDQICKSIKDPAVECVRSWTIIPQDRASDVEFAKARITEGGFDGAIMMRLVGLDEKTRYITTGYVASYATTPYYNPFYGYYSYAWPSVYTQSSTDVTQLVRVETNVYSVKEQKLLWSGISETMDPTSIREMVEQIASEARVILRDNGLLAK